MTDNTLDYVTSPAEAAADPDQAPASDKQRLRIHIPNIPTTLTMGAKAAREGVRDGDDGPINYDGFGVHTRGGHVYLCAEEGVAALKATGSVTVHSSDAHVDVRAARCAYFGSDDQTYVHGKSGTMIVGGGTAQPDIIKSVLPKFAGDLFYGDNGDPDPWTPDDLSDVKASSDSMVQNFTAIQAAIMGISKSLGATASKIGAISAVFGIAKAAGALATAAPGPGVGIHGTEGVTVTSPKAVTLHAHKHILLSSAKESELQSLVTTNVGAGAALFCGSPGATTILGGYGAKVVSGMSTEISSRRGKVAVRAKDIVIGDKVGEFPQVKCEAIAAYAEQVGITAEKNINIGATKELTLSSEHSQLHGKMNACVESPGGAVLFGGRSATIRSSNEIHMGTKGFTLAMKNDSISMGNIKKEWPDAPTEIPLTDMYARIAAAGDDLNMRTMKAVAGEIHAENAAKWDAWIDKVEAIERKNCGITLKDGNVELEVKGYKFKFDNSKIKFANAFEVSK